MDNYYPNEQNNLEEMDEFLEMYNLSRLNYEDTEHMNSPSASKEIEPVTKNFPTKKISGPHGFTGKFYQTFKEESTPILLKLFQKIKGEGTLPNSLWEVSITLTLKLDKDTPRKENFRPVPLINIDAKILNNIPAN